MACAPDEFMPQSRTDTDRAPFWAKHVTLGRVSGSGGTVSYAQGKTDKRSMLARAADMDTGVVYFLAWTGEYRTDLFQVTRADVAWWLTEDQ